MKLAGITPTIVTGTPAASLDNQVPEPVKTERLARLQAMIDRQMQAFNENFVGRRVDVLFANDAWLSLVGGRPVWVVRVYRMAVPSGVQRGWVARGLFGP